MEGMASIEKRTRNDGVRSWRVTWREDGRKRSETFTRERDAITFRGMVDAAGQRYPNGWIPGSGMTAPRSGLTVREWCERAVAARTGITDGTRDRYTALLTRHVYPTLGDLPLDAVNREGAALWLVALERTPAQPRAGQDTDGRTLSPKSVRNIHGLVSSIWNDAVVDEKAPTNPFAGLKLPDDHGADEMCFLTRDEFRTLHDLAPARYRLLLRTLVESGLRWGEVTALQPRHLVGDTLVVDQAWKADAHGRMTFPGPPKTKAGRRTVAIPDALADELRILAGGKRASDYLFTSPDGYPLRNGTFHSRVWGPLVDAAEPVIGKRPRIHDLRHTQVSWLIADGVDVYRIMQRMGHTSVATTQGTYGHLFERDETDVKAAASSGVAASGVTPLRRRRSGQAG
jgi:integrase